MKRTFGFIVLVAMTGIMTVSCSSLKKMKKNADNVTYSVTPGTLVEKGGMVDVRIDITFPEKYFNKKVTLEATPVLRYESGEKAFAMKALQGESVIGNNEVVSQTGKTVTYMSQIPYEDAMRLSELEVDIVGFKGMKSLAFTSRKIADGVVATATMVENLPMFMVGEDKFQRIIAMQEDAAIHYLINSAQLRDKEANSDEMKALENYIKKAVAQENINVKGIDVRSYASPDGPLNWNEKLAQNREKGATTHMKNKLRKDKIEQYKDADFIKQYVVAEDWEGFQKAMESSNVQDKELILRVLSMYSDPEVREREIKNIASAFTVIADEILPKLRRSMFVVNTELIGKSDDELKALALSRPAELNAEELLYAATLFENENDQLAIYQSVVKQNPSDWRGYNNVAMIEYAKGEYDKALRTLEKGNSSGANKQVLANNVATFSLLKGNLTEAAALLGDATGAGTEVDYNKGILAIMGGDYNAAVQYFGDCNSENAALANILTGNYNVAMRKLNAGENTALANYLKAVVGARTNDSNMVMENLGKAIAMDRNFKKVAATDMEFASYFDNAAFEALVK